MIPTPSNREILSVSGLTKSARRLLEGEFPSVFVEGEISNFSTPASGHWYFTLKDDKAQLRCAMFKNRNRLIRFVPRNGLQIIVRGRISLYEGRGEFQMIAEFMEEAGDGELRRSFEKLKTELQMEGLFDNEHKQPLPAIPKHLAIITSPTGAAVRDVIHVLQRRFPAIAVSILPVQVQGEESVNQIVAAIKFANEYEQDPFDAILLTRGGGSLEDLWSFNTGPVAYAIHHSELPLVSAVGHETDVTIADFVADLRAPTPSAAAELLSPDRQTWIDNINQIERTLTRLGRQAYQQIADKLHYLSRRLRHPGQRVQDLHQRLDDLEARLTIGLKHHLGGLDFGNMQLRLQVAMNQKLEAQRARLELASSQLMSPQLKIRQHSMALEQLRQRLEHQSQLFTVNASHKVSHIAARLDGVSPLRTLERGYAIITQGDSHTTVVKNAATLKVGGKINVRLMQGSFLAEILETRAATGAADQEKEE
ncbi:MAG: exodeoxyribonuclease VII large subunit [bacterium]|nr:exodeoxyribonuclease VII large subunit [Gammaproteobacteria bacterium]